MKRGLLVLGVGICSFFLTSLPARASYSRFNGVTGEKKEAYAEKAIHKILRVMNAKREECNALPADQVEPCLIAESAEPGQTFELVPKSIRIHPALVPGSFEESSVEMNNFLFGRNDEIDEVVFELEHDLGGNAGRVIQQARLYLVTSKSVENKDNCGNMAGYTHCQQTCPYRNGTQGAAKALETPEGRFYGLESCFSLHQSYVDLEEPIYTLSGSLVPDDSYRKAPRKTEANADLNISLKQ